MEKIPLYQGGLLQKIQANLPEFHIRCNCCTRVSFVHTNQLKRLHHHLSFTSTFQENLKCLKMIWHLLKFDH